MQGEKDGVDRAGGAQAVEEVVQQRVEAGAGEGAVGAGVAGEEGDGDGAGFAQDIEEGGDLDAGGAVGREEFLALVELDGVEGFQRGLEGDEGVGFLHQGADGDAPTLLSVILASDEGHFCLPCGAMCHEAKKMTIV